jgi:cyanamide hydratase
MIDNVGANAGLIHKSAIEAVCNECPRINWTSCFSSTIHEEISENPWAHTTVIVNFAGKVEANKLMQPYN